MLKNKPIKPLLQLLLLVAVLSFSKIKAEKNIVFNESKDHIHQINPIYIYEDVTNKLSVYEVVRIDSFAINEQTTPNLGLTNSTYWIKFSIKNTSIYENLILGCSYAIIDEIELYKINNDSIYKLSTLGDNFPFSHRTYDLQYFLFDINISNGATQDYILKVKSWEQLVVPLFIGTPKAVFESSLEHDLIFGLFFGVMLVLVFYNLFIYFTVRDSSYLYYVVYIFFITLTQAALNGYSFKFIFPNYPELSNSSLILFNSIAGLATIKFIQTFLKTKIHVPTLNKGYILIIILYVLGILTVIVGYKQISYKLMDLGGFLISFFSLFIAIKIALKGQRYAKFFLLAWSVFLIGVILFVLKNAGILPSNSFTNYTMTFGIAIEGILLSLALADKINIIRNEKEQLVREQNITLEIKVKERTQELNNTLNHLKETQSQLVDAEKMASLGQLTAGIAHEINNPINFVSSNIPPLRQDINDLNTIINKYEELNDSSDFNNKLIEIEKLKKELDYNYLKDELNTIVNGIENGASRTAEIVKSLKNFSRLDEDDLILANINEGITSTLTLLKSKLSGIEIIKKLAPLPKIECYPGKLNQVFMNILSNAIHAIEHHPTRVEKGRIEVTTIDGTDFIKISIADNGIGIKEEVKNKIFDPFFTTKDVGEGTGLGLSIVYRIINKHNGKIEVISKPNLGTTFTISIPKKQNS
ncbi:MAG: GHKL domain-containing protein [Bacteroidetes bacterium]|nr:GHKL domain-containing protein [Bacteroidota bacterium]